MEDLGELKGKAVGSKPGAASGELTDTNNPFWAQDFEDGAEVRVANAREGLCLCGGEFIGGEIAAALLEEREWAVIDDEMAGEEFFGGTKSVGEQFP